MLTCTTRSAGTSTPARAIGSRVRRKKPPTGGVSRITSFTTASRRGARRASKAVPASPSAGGQGKVSSSSCSQASSAGCCSRVSSRQLKRGGGGFVAGEQQQQQLLRHVVVAQGETGFIQATGQQIEAAGGEGRSGGSGGLGLLEHGAQASQQTLAGLTGTGEGAAGQGEREGEETLAPGFEIHEQGIAIDGIEPQHRAGDHAEGKAPQLGHQGHGRCDAEQLLAEPIDQRHDRRAVSLQSSGGEQLAHHPTTGLVIGTVAVGQRQGPQQLPHTVRPPALNCIALGEQVADRLRRRE